jgi:hypothetical protein
MDDQPQGPQPHPMPVDARQYAGAVSLTHYINAYYAIRDALVYSPTRILLIGVGVGLEPILLRHKYGLDVTTFDIDAGFHPDVVGSVHKMDMFADKQFDVAIVSHVLEHLPFALVSTALEEIARVARHAVIYLPYGGRHLEWKFTYAQRYREYAVRLRIPPLNRVDGKTPALQAGQHYWECGYRGFSVSRIRKLIGRFFTIDRMYHNHDFKYSLNFTLTSRS